jgi:hypothetical protein
MTETELTELKLRMKSTHSAPASIRTAVRTPMGANGPILVAINPDATPPYRRVSSMPAVWHDERWMFQLPLPNDSNPERPWHRGEASEPTARRSGNGFLLPKYFLT